MVSMQFSILYICLCMWTEITLGIVDVPSFYRDAPDSVLMNCQSKCMDDPRNRRVCTTLTGTGRPSMKCYVMCGPAFQKNWNLFHPVMRECLGSYYQRFKVAINAYNDLDCGIAEDSFVNLRKRRFKMLNGREASKNQFPWTMRFSYTPTKPVYPIQIQPLVQHTGTAVYIGKGYALTAAHNLASAVNETDKMLVQGGHNQLRHTESADVEKIVLHPSQDLALIKLKERIEGVVPICIAPKTKPFPTKLRVSGWGLDCAWNQIKDCPQHSLLERKKCIFSKCSIGRTMKYVDLNFSPTKPKCPNQYGSQEYFCTEYAVNEPQTLPGDSGAGYASKEKNEETGCADKIDNTINCENLKSYGCERNLQPSTAVHVVPGYLKENCELTCKHCTNPAKTNVVRWQLFGIHIASDIGVGTFADVHSESIFNWICQNAPELRNVPWACARVIH